MLTALMLSCAAVALPAAAVAGPGSRGHWAVGGIGGLAVPSGDLADETVGNQGVGWNAGASVEYFPFERIAVGADLAYESTTGETEASDIDPSGVLTDYQDKAKTLRVGVHGKWLIPAGERILPHLALGFGIYRRRVEQDYEFDISGTTYNYSLEVSDAKPGTSLGVGLDWMANHMVGVGVVGAYHFTFGKFEEEVDVDGDGVGDAVVATDNWSFLVLNAAVTLHFGVTK
jgi:hypothetical protein